MKNEIVQYQGILYMDWNASFMGYMAEILEIEYNKSKMFHWLNNIYDDKIGMWDSRNVFVIRDKKDHNRFVLMDMCREEENCVNWVIQFNKDEEEKYKPEIVKRLKRFSDCILEVIYNKKPDEAEPFFNESTWTNVSKDKKNMYKAVLKKYYVESIEDFLII